MIGTAAFAVEIPFFFLGTPSGHDVEFHLYSWLEVLAQWKQGILYPRWAAQANFGYGEPRFLFYPPASWTLGAAITAVFPWIVASDIYIWIALVAAGMSMFMLVRQWLDPRNAIFAGVLYAVNPYHLVIVYWRSAFAELLASCLLPLLLMFALKLADENVRERRRAILPLGLGLVLAAAWLTNAPAAVMIHYSAALLLVYLSWRQRSVRPVVMGAAAVLIGACLASFYLVPAIYEQKWINIAQAVAVGFRPVDSFLFAHTPDAAHDAFNHLISWVAVWEIAIVFFAAWAAHGWREARSDVWNMLLVWAIGCSLLMFPVTVVLWKILPKMQFMQFPWRWLLCLSLIFSIFVTFGLRRWWWRAGVCAISLLVLALVWHREQAPWWDQSGDLYEMQDNLASGAGYEGTDEYTPAGAHPEDADKDARNVTVSGPAHGAIHVSRWSPESRMFTAEMSARDHLAVKLLAYPAWRVEVNGREVETSATDAGQMLVPVEAGMNRVQISFARTWDRTVGGWISILSALFVGVWVVRIRKSAGSKVNV
ncbi:MAG TPA: 6-pyruvoyl-tetrahydropterin synthase-related protein [Candidatus Sulfotelmatobacter sp.]|jgi:hypothetical protein